MNMKLKPVVGALIVGLIGVAHAACYFEQSYICQANGGGTGEYIYTPSCNPAQQYEQVTATSDWTGWETTQCYDPDTDIDCRGLQTDEQYCQGPGIFYNCITMQYQAIDPAYNGITWYRVDYSASDCGS